MKPKISLNITRENGHGSVVSTSGKQPPTAEMMTSAEALLQFLSTGVDPRAACASCGIRRDKHQVRHNFKEA